MAGMLLLDGSDVARPDRAVIDGPEIWGFFEADGEWCQYDSWLYWGPAMPDMVEALRQAGVPIEERPRAEPMPPG